MLTATINGSIVDPLQASVAASVDGLTGEVVWTPLGARGIGIKSIEKTGTEGLVDTYTITYTDGHTSTYQVRNGEPGKNGATFTPHMDEEANLSWTNDAGLENPEPMNLRGRPGNDGATFTPHVDEDGNLTWTNDANLQNPDEINLKGKEGFSPVVSLEQTEDGLKVTVQNKDGMDSEVIPAMKFETDETLTLKDGILSVNRAEKVEEDNTLPITSAAVFAEVGNINALLATI